MPIYDGVSELGLTGLFDPISLSFDIRSCVIAPQRSVVRSRSGFRDEVDWNGLHSPREMSTFWDHIVLNGYLEPLQYKAWCVSGHRCVRHRCAVGAERCAQGGTGRALLSAL